MNGLPTSARSALLAALAWAPLTVVASSCTYTVPPGTPVAFDTATVWVRQGSDSARLLVEVARTLPQQALGLMDRPSLDALSGMLFVFDEPRSAGFWMWRTRMPLDVAFMDADGVVRSLLTLDPCESLDEDDCPEHRPGVEYLSALEVNAGWFARHGLGVGAQVRVEGAGGGSLPDASRPDLSQMENGERIER